MPKLNRRGDVIMGMGGMPGSLNGVYYPFTTWGRGCWVDDDTIYVGLALAGGALYGWHPFADPSGSAIWLVDPRNFNEIAGGGGRWAALIAGAHPLLFGSLGDLPGAGGADIALDGTMIYKTQYHADWGVTIKPREGPKVDVPSAYPLYYHALDGDQAIWPGGAYGRAPARPAFADAHNVKLATCQGEDWLAYWSESRQGMILQPDGSPDGYVFETSNAFDYDLIALDDVVALASSTTQGEGPSDLTLVHATRAGVWYAVGSGPRPVWGPLASPPPVVQPAFHFTHPVMVRPFFATGSGKADVFTLGTYTESATLPNPMPEGRLVVTHDSAEDWTIPTGLRPYDLLLIEYYRRKVETLNQSADRWLRQTDSLLAQWPGDVGVIPMFYGQGGAPPDELWTVQEVLDGLAYLSTLVNWSARIKVIAPFAYRRANGIIAHVELREAFDNLCTESDRVGEPALIAPVDPPDPPDPPIPPPVLSYFGLTETFPPA